jgi:hypothetical protein
MRKPEQTRSEQLSGQNERERDSRLPATKPSSMNSAAVVSIMMQQHDRHLGPASGRACRRLCNKYAASLAGLLKHSDHGFQGSMVESSTATSEKNDDP